MPAFLAAAHHLSFTRAAEDLCVTQGAISHRIRQLENDLGFPLFRRYTRKIVLTGEGERLYSIMHGPLWDLESEIRRIRHFGLTGTLLVHSPPSLAAVWLVPRLNRFQARQPGIEIHLRSRNDLADFETASVDLALFYGAGQLPSLHVVPLMNEWLVPVCSPEYAAAHGLAQGGVKTLSTCRLLHDNTPWPNAQFFSEWQAWAEHMGLDVPPFRSGHSFDRSELAVTAAENGMGVALGRKRLVQAALDDGRLVAPFKEEMPSPQAYYAVMRREDAQRPRIRAFLSWLQEEADEASSCSRLS